MTRLALGTVQFGLAYGITNDAGQVPEDEVRAILDYAYRAGMGVIDTAALYGSSEQVLGRTMGEKPFSIISKTSKVATGDSESDAVARLEQSFAASLAKLNRPAIAGLIAHESADLLGPFGDALWAVMARFKAEGRVRKIGASIYTGAQVDALLARFPLDLVQVPINCLDHRLVEGGQLQRLEKAGVEVHARSIFLQGLLLQPATKIDPRFAHLPDAVGRLHAVFREFSLSPLEGLIASMLGHRQINRLVVGVTRLREFEELLEAEQKAMSILPDMPEFMERIAKIGITDERILSPARWGELASPAALKN